MKHAMKRFALLLALLMLVQAFLVAPISAAEEVQDLVLSTGAAVTGLKDAFAGKFRVGLAISAGEMRKTQVQQMAVTEYNSVTCENEMKPDSTLDQSACQSRGNNVNTQVRLTDNARSILKFCEDNGIPMRGHVIAWYSQTPSWFFREGFTNNGAIVSKEVMDQRLESFIKNLFELIARDYPKLQIYAWDVCNEAFTDSNPSTMRPANQSNWIAVYGDETYIYKAFEYARKYAPEGTMLCYNDYNEYDAGKLDAIYKLCKDLYEKGLLDAVGMQSHLTVGNPTISKYRAALEKYASIGCKIMITELDVQMRNNNATEQADYYRELFENYVEFADQIEAVVFWGTTDAASWRPNGAPLLFSNYERKPLYDAVMDAIADHDHVYAETVVAPTCTEGGYTLKACTHEGCTRSSTSNATPALGHSWDEGVVTTAPTTAAPGVRTYSCVRCDAAKTARIPRIGATCPDDVDFTNPAAAEQFEVVNQKNAAIVEGTGLTLTCTRPAFETCNGQNSGDQATTPEDVIVVPVEGNWEATLEFVFSTGSASNGYYQFFGFYAGEGEDFQNLAGIRGGDGAMQNFLRIDGAITADTSGLNSTPGLSSNGATYWYKIVKNGDTYTCLRSSNGEDFTEMFKYEDTGIEADRIIIDAYTGMTTGYQMTLKALTFEEGEVVVPEEPAELAIVTEPTDFVGKVGETAAFAVEVNRTDVTYEWLWSKDGGKTWNVSGEKGCDSAEISVQMKQFRVGQMYKVVVTDSTGATVTSAAVKMSTPTAGLKIVADPADVTVAVNQAAAFTVKAEGEGLSYQWMYSNNGGSYWSVSTADGAATASMSIVGKTFRNGQMYKCVVTDASGNVVESVPATMTVG